MLSNLPSCDRRCQEAPGTRLLFRLLVESAPQAQMRWPAKVRCMLAVLDAYQREFPCCEQSPCTREDKLT